MKQIAFVLCSFTIKVYMLSIVRKKKNTAQGTHFSCSVIFLCMQYTLKHIRSTQGDKKHFIKPILQPDHPYPFKTEILIDQYLWSLIYMHFLIAYDAAAIRK